ncbi:PDDEXK family nuclease [Pantoea sp. XAF26B01_ASV70]
MTATLKDKPSDLERLIHESLEQLGWAADATSIAERVNRLNIGLPLEDEFSIICGWLGKCNLVHKLDQQQYPTSSDETFQVPDLLANFKVRGAGNITVLIEVKSCKKNVLSFRPDYVSRLKAYGQMLGLPVLIAWRKYGIWSLVELDIFTKAKKNFNLNFNDAMRNSLMSKFLGDFSYTPQVNSGVHISFKKEKLIKTFKTDEGIQERWKMVIDDVYFTNGQNEQLKHLSPIAQQLFHSWDLTTIESHSESHVVMHNIIDKESAIFAHMALTRLLSFHGREDEVHWRHHLQHDTIISNISDFRGGIEENLKAGIIKYIFDIEPVNTPSFINDV